MKIVKNLQDCYCLTEQQLLRDPDKDCKEKKEREGNKRGKVTIKKLIYAFLRFH